MIKKRICFRAKTIIRPRWVYGNILVPKPQFYEWYMWEDGFQVQINNNTVGQYIGLCDRNDVKVYDGDIISLTLSSGEVVHHEIRMSEEMLAVEIRYLSYPLQCNNFGPLRLSWWNEYKNEIEVIGNIYDNPELINIKE